MRFALSMFLLVLYVGIGFASPSDKNHEGIDLLTKADNLQNLRSADTKPFKIHVTIHAQGIVATPTDGTYDETWVSGEKWERKISFPGFEQEEIGDAASKWISRNLDFQPEVVALTESAVLPRLQLESRESIADFRKAKRDSVEMTCIRTRFKQVPSRELCFDNFSLLVSDEEGAKRFEFSDYVKLGEKMYPRHLRVLYHKKEVLIARMEARGAAPSDNNPIDFRRPPGAVQMTVCDKSAFELLNRVAPHYPEDARSRHVEGTVVIYVLVSGEGKISKMRVLESAGESLDRAATEAVQQWTYRPVECSAISLPFETEISVNFALN